MSYPESILEEKSSVSSSLGEMESAPNRRLPSQSRKNWKRKGSEWELLGSLEKGTEYTIKPKPYEGFLSKRRKWPLKGWHKRYFSVSEGILSYGKTPHDLLRGRTHGRINIGQAVISIKYELLRIDINDEECIHHLKVESMEKFGLWLEQIKQHRLYQQYTFHKEGVNSRDTEGSPPRGASLTRNNKLVTWSTAQHEFHSLDDKVYSRLLHLQRQFSFLSTHSLRFDSEESGNGKKNKLFGLRKKKSSTAGKSSSTSSSTTVFLEDESNMGNMASLSSSNPSISSNISNRPSSLPVSESLKAPVRNSISSELSKDDSISLTLEIQNEIYELISVYTSERDKLKAVIDSNVNEMNSSNQFPSSNSGMRQLLTRYSRVNSLLVSKLQKIHLDSEMSGDLLSDTLPRISNNNNNTTITTTNHSLSYSSSCISGEFFDAKEYASEPSEYSSDDESDNSVSSNSDDDPSYKETIESHSIETPKEIHHYTGRRSKLPVPESETESCNLWNLLCKNIGKDLSKISMPVSLNEPLSVLQRLCEELEYSDLLDKASTAETPSERMMWIVAFAVSAYGSTNARARHKPFNPLLGETYECVREDKGFKYVSEQVSHHPPVSACHASSKSWTWYQDVRVKTKFWGKSMEFQPEGVVSVELRLKDKIEKYSWNKITTCIHNLFGAERWVDLYGRCTISSESYTCNLDFIRASYWSNSKHEVLGNIVLNDSGVVIETIFGKWNEGLYCGQSPSAPCIWRPGALPEDSELYYGFSRFATELNELRVEEKDYLPPTDTRFRPDQRFLENGNIAEAEIVKCKLEQAQRERRSGNHSDKEHIAKWFSKQPEKDLWLFNHEYWNLREHGGFKNMTTDLW